MEKKLYSLKDTKDPTKQDLYIKKSGEVQDFFTYFNSFSLKKWKYYTTLEQVTLRMEVRGKWKITWQSAGEPGIQSLLEETISGGMYEHTMAAESISAVLVGFQLQPLSQDAAIVSGAWYGSFSQWEDKKIGISITTFKRESYVTKNMALLKQFQQDHPWLYLQVVDNGSTLPEEQTDRFRLLHNPNFGGSGGFTRGLIEYVNAGNVDYVLLMDDDINIETSTLERTHSLICSLKKEFAESFLAGAMLQMEEPVIQHENTAYWNKIVSKVRGQNVNLGLLDELCENEIVVHNDNDYAGWWFCCIPVERIKNIGYPLPAFIKSDDMEYGIRNHRELIRMNGIGVWHEAFRKKMTPIIRFFSDRNSFILNHYAHGCDRSTLFIAVVGRLIKRIMKGEFAYISVLSIALEEYRKGFYQITQQSADLYFQTIKNRISNHFQVSSLLNIFGLLVKIMINYNHISAEYVDFRKRELRTEQFWDRYLNCEERE